MNCTQCNTSLQPGWRSCPNCGLQFAQPVPGASMPNQPFPSTIPPKKKPNFLVGCLAVIGVMVLGIGGCVAYVASSSPSSSDSNSASDTTSSSASSDQSNAKVVDVPHVGKREVCTVDGVNYLISKTQLKPSISNYINSTKADGQFLIVQIVADNEDKTTHEINTSLVVIDDSKGREYTSSSIGETALEMTGDQNANLILAQVQPSVVKTVDIVYDIPKGDSGLKLKIPHGTFTDGDDGTIAVPSPG